jgi:hypothetical protein
LLDDDASAISMAGAFFYREPARIFILQVTAIELMMLRMKPAIFPRRHRSFALVETFGILTL